MNNRNNIMTSLITLGTAGALFYGVKKGLKNGALNRIIQPMSNMFNQSEQASQSNEQGYEQLASELQNNFLSSKSDATGSNSSSE